MDFLKRPRSGGFHLPTLGKVVRNLGRFTEIWLILYWNTNPRLRVNSFDRFVGRGVVSRWRGVEAEAGAGAGAGAGTRTREFSIKNQEN